MERAQFAKSMESKILLEKSKRRRCIRYEKPEAIWKEESEIKRVLAEMEKEGKVFMHKDGNI